MKKILIVIAVMALLPAALSGQVRTILNNVDIEIGGGINCYGQGDALKGAVLDEDNKVNYQFYVEGRYNFNNGFDAGLRFGFSELSRENGSEYPTRRLGVLTAVGDYNILKGKKVNPYVGAGIGAGLVYKDALVHTVDLCLMPRIGVKFFDRIDLSVDYRFMNNEENRHAACSVGFIF